MADALVRMTLGSGSFPLAKDTSLHPAQCSVQSLLVFTPFAHDTLKMAMLLITTSPGRLNSFTLHNSGCVRRSRSL